MIQRLIRLPKSNSFFLFGPRGTGKSTVLKTSPFLKPALYIDLLQPESEAQYSLRPGLLTEQVADFTKGRWVVIDEIQKVPKLLNEVHRLIEDQRINFALSGSSSRKLKRGGANLLAGRAFVYALHPFTHRELGDAFKLDSVLAWGALPRLYEFNNDEDRARHLRAYVHTYLKEEIQVEQLVRKLDPFRLFLPIAAQMCGEIVNYSNISKDTGVDHKTVQTYFEILEDTYLGFFLRPFSRSVRQVQKQSPKFYLFDGGVKKALEDRLSIPLSRGTSEYGKAFESWFINECVRLNGYRELDYRFSYLRTKDDVEVDLIIERPDRSIALVEIKSGESIDERHIKSLRLFSKDFPAAQLICAAQVKRPQKIGAISVLPWRQAFQELGF